MESSGGSSQNRYGVVQFTGTNFRNWAYRVRIVLEELEVDAVLSEDKQEDKTWKGKDAKAKSVVVACIADSHLEYVKGCETAKDMMDKLRSTFEKTGLSAQVSARRKLLKLKASDKDDLGKFFVKFEKAISELRMAGAEPDNVELVTTLLAALPASYDGVASDIEASAGALSLVSLDIAKSKLLNEERRKKETTPQQKSNGTSENKHGKSSNASRDQQNRNKSQQSKSSDQSKSSSNHNSQNSSANNNLARNISPWTSYQSGYVSNVTCHHCCKPGHLRPQCPDLAPPRRGIASLLNTYPRYPVGRGRGYPINDS